MIWLREFFSRPMVLKVLILEVLAPLGLLSITGVWRLSPLSRMWGGVDCAESDGNGGGDGRGGLTDINEMVCTLL